MGIAETFRLRIEKTAKAIWPARAEEEVQVDGIAVCTGKQGEDGGMGYVKSLSFFAWLFGEELQETLLSLQRDPENKKLKLKIWVVDSRVREALERLSPPDEWELSLHLSEIAEMGAVVGDLAKEGSKWGTLTKEDTSIHQGKFFEEFHQAFSSLERSVNVAEVLASAMAPKDESELGRIKKAATVTTAVFRNFAIPEIEDVLDTEKSVTHEKLSDRIEEVLLDPAAKAKLKGVKKEVLDSCYPPIIQSGGVYDLKASAMSDSRNLKAGCVLVSFGSRYGLYCANATRTLLIDPTDAQRRNYESLLKAMDAGLAKFVSGNALSSVYDAVSSHLGETLKKHLPKNVGFLTGIEYREPSHVINSKNGKKLEVGMAFNFAVGLSDLEDSTNGKYALMVAETVVVTEGAPEVYTSNIRKDFNRISYQTGGDDEDQENEESVKVKEPSAGKKDRGPAKAREAVDVDTLDRRRRRRDAAATGAATAAATAEEIEQRKKHQDELAKKLREEGMARLRGGQIEIDSEAKEATGMDEYVAYGDPSKLPSGLHTRQLHVDMDAEALIVPINGLPVPFHISTIKNASKTEEQSHTYLRVNFQLPQSIGGSRIGKSTHDELRFPDETAHFVKELSFRAVNGANLGEILRKVKELRKRFMQRQLAAAEAEALVEQAALELERGKRPSLSNVSMRPPIATGKYNLGVLEAHVNGFRYRSVKGGTVDILYNNIKNQFFQEAKNETIVLVHFHLKNPIQVGKKTSQNVQFYTEVMESAVKLSDHRRNRFDQDELEEEQRERELRNHLNKVFLRFVREVEERHQLEFDMPYRQLGFTGAPLNSSVFLMPTVSCIIDLIDWPPFVLNLSEVELAHFERVRFQLRNFDLVFVFKGFEREPRGKSEVQWLRISAIPMTEADSLKKFLDEQLIKYYEGTTNLNWTNLLKTIRQDLEAFYNDGGWSFLELDDAKDENGGDVDGEESLDEGDEEFEVSEEELEEEGSESEDSDYSEDEDDDAAGELSGDEYEGEKDLDSEEEGKDWDELEKEAANDDRRKADFEDDRAGKRSGGTKRSRTKR